MPAEGASAAKRQEWDWEWLADERRGRVYADGRQIGEFDNEADAKLAVWCVNAVRAASEELESNV